MCVCSATGAKPFAQELDMPLRTLFRRWGDQGESAKMNLVLIGYRGTGKSAVGELLSRKLGMRYISMDDEVIRKAGMSIPEIVAQYGWQKFRDIESEVARDMASLDNVIVDTGGGAIERDENVACLQTNSCVFWLKASVATIVARIESGNQRPALTQGKSFTEEVAEVLERRTPLYEKAAHCEIDTDNLTPTQAVEEIIAIWEKRRDSGFLRPDRQKKATSCS